MSEVNIQLSAEALKEVTVTAMMGLLKPDVQERLLREAIQALLNPGSGYGYGQVSPIQRAFNDAVQQIARQQAEAVVREDAALVGKLKELAAETARRVLGMDGDALAAKMADAFVQSIQRN